MQGYRQLMAMEESLEDVASEQGAIDLAHRKLDELVGRALVAGTIDASEAGILLGDDELAASALIGSISRSAQQGQLTSTESDQTADATLLARLEGQAVYPGLVVGPARVVRSKSQLARLRHGDIYVVSDTDWSEWRVLRELPAGVVMERGGRFGHQASGARRLEVPCVAQVATATQVIHDGDVVRIDGSAGTVEILERAPSRQNRHPALHDRRADRAGNIRIVAVDDHQVVGAGIRHALESEPGLEVIGTPATIEEAIDLIDRESPDVVIADVVFPTGPRGLELVDRYGLMPDAPSILLFSNYAPPSMVALALEHGAAGYITKETWGDELVQAIRVVASGGVHVSRQLLAAARTAPEPPSARETEVIEGIARGETNKESAARLGISARTVETHLEHCFARYGVASRAELVALAMREHWLRSAD